MGHDPTAEHRQWPLQVIEGRWIGSRPSHPLIGLADHPGTHPPGGNPDRRGGTADPPGGRADSTAEAPVPWWRADLPGESQDTPGGRSGPERPRQERRTGGGGGQEAEVAEQGWPLTFVT